ncbi:hypothetical protein B0H65DRAFT_340645 [Neurospora tetraspora]|uniref:Uncharacterized protein n=1 Tax=Neurospora tetraspora TaxID=94610 RepID=A0AAE0J185_9PEZI|nr:hypothetical protein B0H65DRAFT_340645 [Neurospora tetraspora]
MHSRRFLHFALTVLFGASVSTALTVPKPGVVPAGAPVAIKARTDSTESTHLPTATSSTTSRNIYPRGIPVRVVDGTTYFPRRRITARDDIVGTEVILATADTDQVEKLVETRNQWIYDYFHPKKHQSSARDKRYKVTDLHEKQPSTPSNTRSPK